MQTGDGRRLKAASEVMFANTNTDNEKSTSESRSSSSKNYNINNNNDKKMRNPGNTRQPMALHLANFVNEIKHQSKSLFLLRETK